MINYEDYKPLYQNLERQFSRLLVTHNYLTIKCEEYEIKIDESELRELEHKETIEKLAKELKYKTWLVGQYLLKYPEYMEVLKKKRSIIKKRTHKSEDSEGVEL